MLGAWDSPVGAKESRVVNLEHIVKRDNFALAGCQDSVVMTFL